jgi:hypothetical protein
MKALRVWAAACDDGLDQRPGAGAGADGEGPRRPGARPDHDDVDRRSERNVFVRESSSDHESLVALNARLTAAGKPPVKSTLAPEELEDGDLLEMANAGLVQTLVVDTSVARRPKRTRRSSRLVHAGILLVQGEYIERRDLKRKTAGAS